ncbi:MAG TPA: M23 family metallopeptidase [Nocardioides sp.]|nr:M23 family metallopeptidase [Nocardioides sp.]
MSFPTARLTRVPGLVLGVALGLVAALWPAPALGTSAEVDPLGVWPLRPRPEVVAGFDPPLDPWGSGHRGVDLLASAGQQVRAALPGRVTFAGMLAGRGVVVVSHGDTRTTYEPVAADVAVGEPVAAGGRLGRLGGFGSHCFPLACLHWGWLRGETYLDPLDLVGGGPVRLLPLWRDEPVPSATTLVPTPLISGYSLWGSPLLRLLNPVG